MHELIPLAAGFFVGAAVSFIPRTGLRVALFAILSVVVGALVSLLMGELATGLAPLFVGFDALLVWIGGLVAVLVAGWLRARGARGAVRSS